MVPPAPPPAPAAPIVAPEPPEAPCVPPAPVPAGVPPSPPLPLVAAENSLPPQPATKSKPAMAANEVIPISISLPAFGHLPRLSPGPRARYLASLATEDTMRIGICSYSFHRLLASGKQ